MSESVDGMQYKVIFLGKLDGLNQYIEACRKSKYGGNTMKQAAQGKLEFAINAQLPGVRISRPVIIHYRYFEQRANRDADNIAGFAHKVFQDALVACKVLPNDNQKYVRGFTDSFGRDRENPRIEIRIEEIEE